ncbi:MAG: Lrp/AsnC family transcriptional regulator [Calditrichaeota bacterium]|nr:Lrp/AsnC family transcriptional regulator [Calditrichota bacterium]MCB0302792.1 Lrp/AsnC family transcriptional regulator [Calditrichota bacterium]MCB0314674.1 Lrp/AsnC family transcriptional regulator [Calditrichota bacterium]MCB9090842.1 Lrp/AsnC family transcriptional regulator [Calditrichia bacterium]
MKLDDIDINILNILQSNGRITNSQLAADIGISPPASLERVKRLENAGVIRRYVALVDPAHIDKGVFALVLVSLAIHQLQSIDQFTAEIKKLPEVLECYHITGEEDFLLKIAVKDIAGYEDFILTKLTRIPGVRQMKTSFVLSTVKYDTRIPVDSLTNGQER